MSQIVGHIKLLTFIDYSLAHFRIRHVAFLGLIVLAFVWFDYAIAGAIKMPGATMFDVARNREFALYTPVSLDSYGVGDKYHFTFTAPSLWILDYFYPPHLWPDNCLEAIYFEGKPVSLSQYKPEQLCDATATLSLGDFSLPLIGNRLEIIVKDASPTRFGFNLTRESLLGGAARIALIIFGVYCLTLSTVCNYRHAIRLHYAWAVCLLFVFSFLPHNYNLGDYWWWVNYLANGLAVAAASFLLALLPPVRGLYNYAEAQVRKLAHAPTSLLLFVIIAFFAAVAVWLSHVVFHFIPHTADSHINYMQSKVFAAGDLYEKSHPLRDFFNFQFIVDNGEKYFSPYFPGFPAILALGQLLGLPWIINPLMGGLTVGVIFLLARELGDHKTAYLAAILACTSPTLLFMSAEYMTHPSCMLFLTLFAYMYLLMHKTNKVTFAFLAGCCLGMAFIIRVQTAVPFAFFIGIHAAYSFFRHPRKNFSTSLGLTLGFGIFASALMYYNFVTMGDPFKSGYTAHGDQGLRFKNYQHMWAWTSWFWGDISRAVWQMQILHQRLFSWPTSSLLFVLFAVLLNRNPKVFLLLGCVAGQFLALIFIYPDAGSIYYPRYIYESSAILIVLSALGIRSIVSNAEAVLKAHVDPVVIRACAAITLLSLTLLAFPSRTIDQYREYSNNYWEGNWGYYYFLSRSVHTPAIVFIAPYEAYRLVYFTQPPQDSSPIIFALDRGEQNKLLMDFYPDRHVYVATWTDLKQVR